MKLVQYQADRGSIRAICQALKVSRATFYRHRNQQPKQSQKTSHPRRLSAPERQQILDILCSPEFMDLSPYQIHAKLLQRGQYLCSVRTMYRLLHENSATLERRQLRRHPDYPKPQLQAQAPNQIWTWDITKLPGPAKGLFYCLYVVLDLFSRYVVSWTVESSESTATAKRLLAHGLTTQNVGVDQVTLHADRGSPMTSHGLHAFMASLGVKGSHSRPRVSNDNPFSESHFKTVKYHRHYPKRFESLHQAQTYFQSFFAWYNHDHHHINLGFFTPCQVHTGAYKHLQVIRQAALDLAYSVHPERFVKGPPRTPQVPLLVAINPDPPPLTDHVPPLSTVP